METLFLRSFVELVILYNCILIIRAQLTRKWEAMYAYFMHICIKNMNFACCVSLEREKGEKMLQQYRKNKLEILKFFTKKIFFGRKRVHPVSWLVLVVLIRESQKNMWSFYNLINDTFSFSSLSNCMRKKVHDEERSLLKSFLRKCSSTIF